MRVRWGNGVILHQNKNLFRYSFWVGYVMCVHTRYVRTYLDKYEYTNSCWYELLCRNIIYNHPKKILRKFLSSLHLLTAVRELSNKNQFEMNIFMLYKRLPTKLLFILCRTSYKKKPFYDTLDWQSSNMVLCRSVWSFTRINRF